MKSSCLFFLSFTLIIKNILCDNYGVDVSFPIHHKIDPNTYQGKRYREFMDGCAKAFSKRECEATEEARFRMSREQPATQYNYTEIGFKKVRTPQHVFDMLKDFYEANKANKHVEQWGRAYTYTNNWASPTYMISVEDTGLRGAGALLKSKIWEGIRPIIEEWTGHKLKPTSLYGIREYVTGAILSTHVDRIPLVSSCIINVAQDLDEPWPLEVYDHAGRAHNVTMEPGDLVLYESHTVLHGRPFPLKGKYFANIFVHFEPVDHAEMNRKIHEKLANVVLAEKINPRDYDPEAEDFSKVSQQNHENKRDDDDQITEEVEHEEPGFEINHAAARNDLQTVKSILETNLHAIHNADKNGWQPIHEAVRAGNTKMVKFLINMGADMGAKTRNGGSPLWWAKRALPKGHPTINYLEQIGAPENGEEF